jgi:hypothetical protein
MKKYIVIILLIGLGGCATMTKPGAPFYSVGQKGKLDKATKLLEQGKTAAAEKLLTEISNEPGVPGVTDEALLRLGILRLGSRVTTDSIEKSRKELDRLAKDFPASSWTLLSLPLRDFLASANKSKQQGKKLAEQNLSLTKENKECKENSLSMAKELKNIKDANVSLTKENTDLRQRVEKIKSLDLDMEKGSKRFGRPRAR